MMREKKGLGIGMSIFYAMRYNVHMQTRTTTDMVYAKLGTVMDPELDVDIVSLGLIYGVKIKDQKSKIKNSIENSKLTIVVTMTLTTPGCPLAPVIDRMIRDSLKPLKADKVELKLVWEPAWTTDLMSEEAKLRLGMM